MLFGKDLTLYQQGLKLALANSQNASENKKLRVQSASLSHFLRVQKNHRKQSILANLTHNWKYGTPLSDRRLLSMVLV